jgi:predicted anti-sigma-YlaC factor YlaD
MGSGLAIGYAGPGALLSYVTSAAIAIAVTMVLAGRAWRFSVIIGVAWLALTVIAFVLGRHIRNAT